MLVLDEPTNHLDIDSKEVFEDALMEYPGTVIVVSHDRYFLNKIPTRILELEKEGLTEYLGTYDYYVEKKASIESGKRYLKEMSEAEKVNGAEIDFDQGTNLSPAEERALKKKKEAEERRRIREKERLESLIEELEDKIGQTEGEMCKPENLANTGLLTELDEKVKDLRVKLEEAYDNWMEL